MPNVVSIGIAEPMPELLQCGMSAPTEHIGHRIEAALKRANMSKAEFARRMGVKPPSVTEWVSHGRIAKTRIVEAARTLSVSVDYLLGGDPPQNKVQEPKFATYQLRPPPPKFARAEETFRQKTLAEIFALLQRADTEHLSKVRDAALQAMMDTDAGKTKTGT
jgi:transcriptional regulator with XRE-family HTH domain